MTGHAATKRQSSRHLVAPELLAGLAVLPDLDLSDDYIASLRQGTGALGRIPRPPLPPELEAVECRELHVPGPDGAPDVRILLYLPDETPSALRPALLHIHGGGYVMGNPEINDASNRAHARNQGCVVVSVDYRLAPETRWPGPLEDCYAALRWLAGEADALGVDRNRIAIAGESAGGGHAAALSQLARDRGEFPICFLLLDSPMLDDRTGSSSEPHPYTGEFVWTPERNRYGWGALLGSEPGSDDIPDGAVPARAANLADLPATCITIGALDLFLEESLDYVRRLSRAGVPVELHVLPGAYHGYGIAGETAPQIARNAGLRRDALRRAFQGL
ncbi:MAG: alpha/beta hydrolase [Sphingobium sp.]